MKLGLALAAIILTITSSGFAEDKSMSVNLLPGQTVVEKFNVNSETSFEVYAPADSVELSCQIYLSDQMVTQDPHVHHCFAVVHTDKPVNVYLKVTNNGTHDSIFVIDQK